MNHVPVNELPYCEPVKKWLMDRYGKDADRIWKETVQNYNTFLLDLPDYGGKKNGHARAIYGGLLVFSLYPALPDEPPISEMQEFVNNLFMGPFTKLGKIFDLNRSFDIWLIDKVFRKSGNRDRKDIRQYPAGFVNVDEPYDREHHMTGNIMLPVIISHSARMRNLQKAMIFFMCFRSCATRTSSGSARSTAS